MLILIAGITGNIGSKLIAPLLARGHQVRGLGRNASKLSEAQTKALESFHAIQDWHDVKSIRKALKGVDAVICTYAPHPLLALEAQLLLARLMEEEGVMRLVTSSFNLDWTAIAWGDVPYYDVFLAFKRQLEMTSRVKPFYVFVGILAETFFSVPGHGGFAPSNHGVWDPIPGAPRIEVWGTGDEKWQITSEQDTAEFVAELVGDRSQDQGVYRFCGGEYTSREIAKIYEHERGVPVILDQKGTLEELKKEADATQKELGLAKFWDWMGYYYQYNQLAGKTMMLQLDISRYPRVKTVDLVEFLTQHPEV